MHHNPTQHFAPLRIGKREYFLTFDLDAVARAESLTGQRLLFAIEWSQVNATMLVGMLYAAMLPKQPETTLEQVRKLVVPRNCPAISSALYEAWFQNAAEPDEDEEASENPPTPKA